MKKFKVKFIETHTSHTEAYIVINAADQNQAKDMVINGKFNRQKMLSKGTFYSDKGSEFKYDVKTVSEIS